MTREEALTALGLESGATQEEIAAANRELAQMLQPDKYGKSKRLRERAEQQMRVINEAPARTESRAIPVRTRVTRRAIRRVLPARSPQRAIRQLPLLGVSLRQESHCSVWAMRICAR